MNTQMTRRFLVATLAIATTIPNFAQEGRPVDGSRRLDFLAGYLGLSEAQKTQAKAIFDAAGQAAEMPLGQLAGARDALRQAVKDNKPDAELDRLAAAVGTLEGQLAAIHAKASAKFYALLNSEQKQKYDQLRDRPGPGRRGGDPRP